MKSECLSHKYHFLNRTSLLPKTFITNTDKKIWPFCSNKSYLYKGLAQDLFMYTNILCMLDEIFFQPKETKIMASAEHKINKQ